MHFADYFVSHLSYKVVHSIATALVQLLPETRIDRILRSQYLVTDSARFFVVFCLVELFFNKCWKLSLLSSSRPSTTFLMMFLYYFAVISNVKLEMCLSYHAAVYCFNLVIFDITILVAAILMKISIKCYQALVQTRILITQ